MSNKYSPADVLKYYMLSTTPPLATKTSDQKDWGITVSSMPEPGDNALTVYDTTGKQDGRYMATGERVVHPGVQIRIRGKDSKVAYNKGIEIVDVLDAVGADQQNGVAVLVGPDEVSYRLQNCSRTTDVMYLMEEPERRRVIYVVNYILTIEENF